MSLLLCSCFEPTRPTRGSRRRLMTCGLILLLLLLQRIRASAHGLLAGWHGPPGAGRSGPGPAGYGPDAALSAGQHVRRRRARTPRNGAGTREARTRAARTARARDLGPLQGGDAQERSRRHAARNARHAGTARTRTALLRTARSALARTPSPVSSCCSTNTSISPCRDHVLSCSGFFQRKWL